MVRQYNWYDAILTKRMRYVLTAIVWIAWLTIFFLQYEHIVQLFQLLKQYL